MNETTGRVELKGIMAKSGSKRSGFRGEREKRKEARGGVGGAHRQSCRRVKEVALPCTLKEGKGKINGKRKGFKGGSGGL